MRGAVKAHQGTTLFYATLLEEASGIINGEWHYVAGVQPLSISVRGIVGDMVQIWGSLSPEEPATLDDPHLLHPNFTEDTLAVLEAPVQWIKAKVSAWNTGTITVRLFGPYRI